jgi:hypothetical protein
VDPITKDYPELTPYQFASNTPIFGIDLDGKELLGYKWLFDIWLEWKFGDPTGAKRFKAGAEKKIAIENGLMPYHNDNVPKQVQNQLDHINNIEANTKLVAGANQYGIFILSTWADISTSIIPLGEAGVIIRSEMSALRVRVATKVYEANGLKGSRLIDHLKYYDFDQKVYKGALEEGTELVQYKLKNSKGGIGDYYAPKDTKPEEIGLSFDDIDWENSFSVKLDFKVEGNLISTHAKNKPLYYDPSRISTGGGTQIYNPDLKNYATFSKIEKPNL